jgi:hypothetical protein
LSSVIVVDVVLGLLVVVGQHVVVVVVVILCRRRRLPCSMTRRRWMVKLEVLVAEEACLPPRILLGLAPGVPGVGVDSEGGIRSEVRRRVPPPAPDLGAPAWLKIASSREYIWTEAQ